MARNGDDDLLEQLERPFDVAKMRGAQIGATEFELRHLRARRQWQPGFEQLFEVAPTLPGRVEPIEGPMGAQIVAIDLQHLLVSGERVIGVGEVGLVELRHFRQQIEPFVRVERSELAGVEQPAQLRPALTVSIKPRKRPEGARVQRLGGEDLGVDLLGLRRAPQALLLELGDDDQQVAPQDLIVGGGRHRPQGGGQLGAGAGALGKPDQRVPVLDVRGVNLEQGQAGAIRPRPIVERRAIELAQLLESFDLLSARVGDGEESLVSRGQLGGITGPLIMGGGEPGGGRPIRVSRGEQPFDARHRLPGVRVALAAPRGSWRRSPRHRRDASLESRRSG